MSRIVLCTEEVKRTIAFEDLNTNDLISMLSNIFEQIVDSNEQPLISENTDFNASLQPKLPIKDYIERIFKLTKTEKEVLITALCYIDRIMTKHQNFFLTVYNIHR